ncbi:MAG: dephospho-CoA kinase [bacterium]|nr:dephospho-CoA kinase [bacterium]
MSKVWLGVTGNIGAGKSTVARFLAKFGAGVVDADAEAHAMADQDPSYRHALMERFGDGLYSVDGKLNRGELAHRLFGDPIAVSDFNAIVAPRLVQRTRSKLTKLAETHPVVVLDGALIFEYGRNTDFQEVWLVVAKPEIVIARMKERGYTDEQIKRRAAAQWSEESKRKLASRIIENNSTPDELELTLRAFWNGLVSK